MMARERKDYFYRKAKSEGYRVKAETPGKMPLVVRAFNLSGQPEEVTLNLSFSEAAAEVLDPQARRATIPAEGFVDVAWQVDLSGALAPSGHLAATIEATGKTSGRRASLQLDLSGGATRK